MSSGFCAFAASSGDASLSNARSAAGRMVTVCSTMPLPSGRTVINTSEVKQPDNPMAHAAMIVVASDRLNTSMFLADDMQLGDRPVVGLLVRQFGQAKIPGLPRLEGKRHWNFERVLERGGHRDDRGIAVPCSGPAPT